MESTTYYLCQRCSQLVQDPHICPFPVVNIPPIITPPLDCPTVVAPGPDGGWAIIPPPDERTGIDARGLELKSTNPKDVIGIKKCPLHLIPSTAKAILAMAFKNGAIKYGPYNWRDEGVSASVYVGAAERHIDEWYDGEELAGDSGVHHIGHAMACLAILYDALTCGTLVDDRPTPAPTAALHDKLKEE